MQTVNPPSITLARPPSVTVTSTKPPSVTPSGPVICPVAAGQAGGITTNCQCPNSTDYSFKSSYQGKTFTYWCTDNS